MMSSYIKNANTSPLGNVVGVKCHIRSIRKRKGISSAFNLASLPTLTSVSVELLCNEIDPQPVEKLRARHLLFTRVYPSGQ